MLLKFIIDGYNVLHGISSYKYQLNDDLEKARNLLIHDIKNFSEIKKIEVCVVFDGSSLIQPISSHGSTSKVKIIYSKSPKTADDKIIELVQTEKHSRRITVVTNDQQIIRYARLEGCSALSPAEFYRRIKSRTNSTQLNDKYEANMSKDELDEWKKLFGVGD